MSQHNVKILNWNVRGLNEGARQDCVQEVVSHTGSTIVCLQETKLQVINTRVAARTLGAKFLNNMAVLPATDTRGGILLAASEDYFTLSQISTTTYTVSALVTMKSDNSNWWITGVYGPQSDSDKLLFLQELKDLANQQRERWLILGDFNLILQASDKNNANLNRRLMGAFKTAMDSLLMKEIRLNGRRYTWSNGQQNPTLTRIDRFFCTAAWEIFFPCCFLPSLPSLTSDHTPLFLHGELAQRPNHSFRFENYWVKMDGFKEAVQSAWSKQITSSHLPLKRLHIKLARTAKAIKAWRKAKIGDTKLQLVIVKEVILRLETAQEDRTLTFEELELLKKLKLRSLGLALIEKSRIRQLTHQDKESLIADHFKLQLGTSPDREITLDWNSLNLPHVDLSPLEAPFSQEEIKETIFSMPGDKAPGPDGFTGTFFKTCWDIIKDDVTAAFHQLHDLNGSHFKLLNSANIVLIPKKLEAKYVGDYRPISLIHGIAKIFSKLLANRLAPYLDTLVSKSQSAFVRKRCIQDNFLYVQNTARKLHKLKKPALFLKLDIQKAFDSVNWGYLLEILELMGFGHRWREWISILFGSTSSRVLLNGRETALSIGGGDPLSPMLFILAIDPLQQILNLATQHGILTPLPLTSAKLRTSLYADDAAIFLNPVREELAALKEILHIFCKASGLVTNFEKSSIHPIRCEEIDLDHVLHHFQGSRGAFPCRYLGLQLHTRPLRKVHIQPLIEKIENRLAGWKGHLLNRAGRLTLVSLVLSSMPTYHLSVFPLAAWARKRIDKIHRSFLWKGKAETNGGHCLVSWPLINKPKDLAMSSTFAGCGERGEMRDEDHPWQDAPCDRTDRLFFCASTRVSTGDGRKAKFWHDSWLDGMAPRNLAPHLFELVARKNNPVASELLGDNWINSVKNKITTTIELVEFVSLWTKIQDVHLQPGIPDSITWKWTPDSIFSVKSAYRAQFLGSFRHLKADLIWKARAKPKCKFFAWILLQNKILTADNLAVRGWPHQQACTLCYGPMETGLHLSLHCPFAQEVWNQVLAQENLTLLPQADFTLFPSIADWWQCAAASFPKDRRRDFNGASTFIMWNIWKEWNRRIFEGSCLGDPATPYGSHRHRSSINKTKTYQAAGN
ncbi:hypothetical protein U9M48_042292 [Paspalum notatum var. saurae]|uniref:Reverse transcriptase domain-containing protein n=1 Tax=Paspalum notatum var. saurae TaxID=547442 RepID=A0AAQ3XF26_PASNO